MKSNLSRRRRKGNIFVELSFIFTTFFFMLYSAFDFAQFLFVHQALVERARSSVRWGAVHTPSDSTSITNMVLYNQPDAPTITSTPTYFNLSTSNVSVTNPGSGTDDYRLNLTISGYSYNILSPYIGGSYTGPPVTVSIPLGMY